MTSIGDSTNGSSRPTVGYALGRLARHPVHYFIIDWNWKTAFFSGMNRGTIYLIAMIRRGNVEISVAIIVEAIFSATASGVYGAFTQAMRFARPRWLARLTVAMLLPAIMLGLDYLAHHYTGMRNMRLSLIFTGLLSVISSLFTFYTMGEGALLVGNQGQPLYRDLMRMPVLIAKFIIAGPRWIWNYVAGSKKKGAMKLPLESRNLNDHSVGEACD